MKPSYLVVSFITLFLTLFSNKLSLASNRLSCSGPFKGNISGKNRPVDHEDPSQQFRTVGLVHLNDVQHRLEGLRMKKKNTPVFHNIRIKVNWWPSFTLVGTRRVTLESN